jgi:glycine C-acetyltransferase
MAYTNSKNIFSDVLDQIKTEGLFKEERIIDSAQSGEILVRFPSNGPERKILNLCSNNYLGLSSHPDVIKAAHEGLEKRGFGMSSVRFICGTQDIHRELEQKMAAFLGTEDAILFSSCFDAMQLCLKHFSVRKMPFFQTNWSTHRLSMVSACANRNDLCLNIPTWKI